MHRKRLGLACAAAIALSAVAGPASAQGLLDQIPGGGGNLGQAASGLLGRGVPSVGSAPSGNVAGVLSYCLQNNAVGANGAPNAGATLGTLTGNGQANPNSSAYRSGQQGTLETGSSGGLSLANLPDGVRQRVCQEVLARAKSML